MPVFLRMAALCGLLALFGCRSASPPPSSVVPASSSVSVPSVRTTASASVSRVQSLPAYRKAEAAFAAKRFAEASRLLDTLLSLPDLSSDERAFLIRQKALCAPTPGLSPKNRGGENSGFNASTPNAQRRTPDADCGPKALALVCAQLGVKTSVARLRALAGTDANGTSMAGLTRAAQGVGLQAEGVQVSREALAEVELPAIAWVNQHHYVAVLKMAGEGETATATIRDPNQGEEETMLREQLLRLCGGYLLLVRR